VNVLGEGQILEAVCVWACVGHWPVPVVDQRWCTERHRLVVDFGLALAAAPIVGGWLVRRGWTNYRWDGRPRRRP
jgi:hypothetical protein